MSVENVLKSAIEQLAANRSLSREQTRAVFEVLTSGQADENEMADFLLAMERKGPTVDEIAGAADLMNEKVTRVNCEADCIDTCGTGGDGISTFNVSTTVAIIAAAAGATVAKHGNISHTRASGSAQAMAALGVNIDAPVPVLERCLRECRLAFLAARNLHPSMKHVAGVRQKLGIRTIFNLLGPLTNPAGARRQLLGTCKAELTETLAQVLLARGATMAWVVYGQDGLSDLTITAPTRVTEVRDGRLRTFEVRPEEVGLERAPLDTLLIDSPQASAEAIQAILAGQDRGPRRHYTLLNAAAALIVAGLVDDLPAGIARAGDAIDSGAAQKTLDALIRTSNS